MKISEFLPKLKANRYTYRNISNQGIKDFKKQYNYLVKHKDKEVYNLCIDEVNKWLDNDNPVFYNLSFLNKLKAIQVLSTNIKH